MFYMTCHSIIIISYFDYTLSLFLFYKYIYDIKYDSFLNLLISHFTNEYDMDTLRNCIYYIYLYTTQL